MPLRSPRAGIAVLLLGAALTACSSAPAPAALDTAPDGGTSTGTTTGVTAPDTTGATAPGTSTSGTPGATSGVAAPRTAGGGTTGVSRPGTTGTAGGVQATTGTSGGAVAPPRSTLFTAKEDRIGISKTGISICAHAALTYGAAFGTNADQLNVYWQALNDKGGIYGRKVTVTYENDDYKPETAVQAATACEAKKIFMLLGGIGFDQIPAVRNWAETHHMLYLHHTATIKGSVGQRYSFSELPTVERTGEGFAQLAGQKYRGKKIGVIERDSPNWAPGVTAFKKVAAKYGITLVVDRKVAQNKGSYTDDLAAMRNAGVDVVWVWLNALESTQLIKQAKVQQFNPHWLMFPFNLTSQTLANDAMNPPLDGVAMYPAYSHLDYTGPFSTYAADMKEFVAQYRKYQPNADLSGISGDLLFLNWTGQKALAAQLKQCGPDCSRNRFVDVLQSYTGQVPIKAACPIDFRGDGHHGSDSLVFMETYRAPDGKVNWRNTKACVRP